jgi:hypothetical protein
MLFDTPNPYRPLPTELRLDWADFTCGLSPANEAALGQAASWTVLAYLAADNDLAAYIFDNLVALKAQGSTPAAHVLALFDGPLLTDSFFARLNAGTPLADDILLRFNELHTNDPATLGLALRLARAYPARHRLVVLGGHGRGWQGLLLDENQGQKPREKPWLTLPGPGQECDHRLHAFLAGVQARLNTVPGFHEAAGPIDVLALDVCLGGNIETLSSLAEQAEWLVVSQNTMPGEGLAYAAILADIERVPGQSPEHLATSLVTATGRYYRALPSHHGPLHLAALRTAALPSLCADLAGLIRALDLSDAAIFAAVRRAIEGAWTFDLTDAIDLRGFVLQLRGNALPPAAAAAADALLQRWPNLVAAFTGEGGATAPNGLSIYAPPPRAFDPAYIALSNGFNNGLGVWAWFLADYYLRWLGEEAPDHPLLAAIAATMQAAIARGDYTPVPAAAEIPP